MGRPCLCCCPDCNACISKENFDQYDYALLICNVNSVTDDNFDLYLNEILLGSVSELAENKCKGKWFVTSPDAVEKIKNNINSPCRKNDINPPQCCLDNTTSIQLLSGENKSVFFAEWFTVFLKNKKNNQNGNFGFIGIWRIKKSSVCQVAKGEYSGGSGSDITTSLSTTQKICCCDLIFKELVYEISGGNIWPAYDAFVVECTLNLGEPTGKSYLWSFSGGEIKPCRSSPPSIDGTYILSRSSEVDDNNCITAINSIDTDSVTLNNDFSQVRVCPNDSFSYFGPGFKQLSKKVCLTNPYTFEIRPRVFVRTGNIIRCWNGTMGWGNFPEVKMIDPIKIKVTGIPE